MSVAADNTSRAVGLPEGLASSEWVRRPRQARSEETLNRFLDATAELLAERRFDEISVNDICERAARTVGSFYARFDDKSCVLRVLVEQVASHLQAEAEAYWTTATFAGAPLVEIVERTVDAVLNAYRQAGAVFHAAAIAAPNDEAFRDARLGVWTACAEGFAEVLVEHGEELTHPEPERAGQLAMTAMISVVDVRMIYGPEVRPRCGSDDDLRADLIVLLRSILHPCLPD